MPPEIARVLIVDDSLTNRLVLDSYVKALGYQSTMAVDGAAALERIRAEPTDLVLLDIIMPKMDGHEVLALHPGDALLLFTDGITEASSPAGTMFGLKGIQNRLAAPVASANEVIQQILTGLHAHEAGTRPHDDQTMVAIWVRP